MSPEPKVDPLVSSIAHMPEAARSVLGQFVGLLLLPETAAPNNEKLSAREAAVIVWMRALKSEEREFVGEVLKLAV